MKSYCCWLCEQETEKSCREKFQKHVFGEFRGLEADTPIEADMYEKILKWLATANPSGDSEARKAMDVFDTLKDCQKYYRKELTPKAKTVYRGKVIPVKDILKGTPQTSKGISSNILGNIRSNGYLFTMFSQAMIKSGKMSKDTFNSAEGYMQAEIEKHKILGSNGTSFVNVPYTFKPSKKISSWSTEFAHAMQFAFSEDMSYSKHRYDLKYVAVVIEIPVDGNFVMNNKFMNLLGREAGHVYGEDEVIRVSNSPAKGKVHFMHGSRKIAEMLK